MEPVLLLAVSTTFFQEQNVLPDKQCTSEHFCRACDKKNIKLGMASYLSRHLCRIYPSWLFSIFEHQGMSLWE